MKGDDQILDFDKEIGVVRISHKAQVYWREIGTDEVWSNEQMRSRGIAGKNLQHINVSLQVPGGKV